MPNSELLKAYFEHPKDFLMGEVQNIKSPGIRRFTLEALDAVDPKFWIHPCSSSGKYHPPEDQGEGGLTRHVIKAVAVAKQDIRRFSFFDFKEVEKDIVISAVILHDTCKNGIPWGEQADYSHGLIAAKWLERFNLDNLTVKRKIINAVRYHMGRWSEPDEEVRIAIRPTITQRIVQNADFFASRQSMSFLPGVSII